MAIADGAGSAPRGAEGAERAARAAVSAARDALEHRPEPTNVPEWVAYHFSNSLQTVRAILETFPDPAIGGHEEMYAQVQPQVTPNIEVSSLAQWEIHSDVETIQPSETNSFPQLAYALDKPRRSIHSLRIFATTLQLAIVTTHWLAVVQIGDGAVVIQRTDGKLQVLTKPDHGEYLE